MPQSPLNYSAVYAGRQVPLRMDPATGLMLETTRAGQNTSLNISTQKIIKATPGIVAKIIFIAPGTGTAWSLNDCSTVAGISAANLVWELPVAGATEGTIIDLDFPFMTGIIISTPTTGSPIASISFT